MEESAIFAYVGHRLKVAIVEARLTQVEAAERMGFTPGTVSKHVNGAPMPLETLYRYGTALGVEPTSLLPRLDSNQQPADQWTLAA